jgi:hypothetical protein
LSSFRVAGADRPIIFSPDMVRRIQSGDKTQTRRVVKPPPVRVLRLDRSEPLVRLKARCEDGAVRWIECPHAVGDVLWIRESWHASFDWNGSVRSWHDVPAKARTERRCVSLVYEADGPAAADRWVTPVFMPRWAARLGVRIDAVRAEPLQDISAFDVRDEGVDPLPADRTLRDDTRDGPRDDPFVGAFRERWNHLHDRRGPSWADDPWVWVMDFTPLG